MWQTWYYSILARRLMLLFTAYSYQSSSFISSFINIKLIKLYFKLYPYQALFLLNRSMRVTIDGEKSRPRDVISGVIQGSVLGPPLFLIYVNHIGSNICPAVTKYLLTILKYTCISHRNKSYPASVWYDTSKTPWLAMNERASFLYVEKGHICTCARADAP